MQTCLVVDDAPVIRKIASHILLQFGLAVESVANAEEAREWIKENGLPDIAIVAACPSDSAGPQLVDDMRRMAKGTGLVILASIVDANLGLMTRLKRAGATDYIYKPFDRDALRSWIKPYLESSAAA
ncbi:MAG TPA: response regulator [Aurantimonas sp.]|uniref:Response regulator n=1 Tax=Aurantimonas marianensis TaxID=2920428 RepID=A0A9X2KE04_9HYPH|nr:response regulator [Aurantimonas marianensis]MCP3054923.1 response regulator [Aurantimonas marianensis]